MAEIINNSASTSYTYEGSGEVLNATSNNVPINFETTGGITIQKSVTPTTFTVGDILSYSITITNSGTNYLNGVRIIDDLGEGYLAYVLGTGSLTTSSQTYAVNPIATSPLTFTLQQLAVGETMTLNYRAQVVFNLPPNVTSITNTAKAIGYPYSGTVVDYSSATIQKKNSVSFSIVKSATETEVTPNQNFSYLITLNNGNTVQANVNNITDNLPDNFTLTEVRVQIGGASPIVLNSSDYTLSGGNLLIVPSATGPSITVPANGSTVLTLSGYLR